MLTKTGSSSASGKESYPSGHVKQHDSLKTAKMKDIARWQHEKVAAKESWPWNINNTSRKKKKKSPTRHIYIGYQDSNVQYLPHHLKERKTYTLHLLALPCGLKPPCPKSLLPDMPGI